MAKGSGSRVVKFSIMAMIIFSHFNCNAQLVMEAHIYKRVVEDVHTVFNNTCIIFLYTVENPMQALGVYEAEQLMSIPVYIARLHIRTFAYAIKTFKESIGDSYFNLKRPLFVLVNDSEEMRQQFSNEISPWIAMAYINWVIFFREGTKAEDFFANIYVPLDCIFLVVQRIPGARGLEISEVYNIAEDRGTIKRHYGTWDETEGLRVTKLALYQRRSDLQGHVIRTGTVEDPPISTVQRDASSGEITGITGFFGTIIQLLEENMNCTMTYVSSQTWGSKSSNGSWSGIVGMLVRKEIDLAAAGLTMTSDRLDDVKFTTPVFTTKYRIYIKRPYYTAIKWTAYSDPFYPGIWTSLLIVIALSSALTLMGCKTLQSVQRSVPPERRNEASLELTETVFHTFGALCAQGHDSVNIDSIRIINWVVHMTGAIILAAYSAALISFLAIKVFVMPFTSMEGLLNDGTYKLTVIIDSADYGFFEFFMYNTLRELFAPLLAAPQ